jgi:diguanylate cyclase (GGDEF)-like protein
MRLNLHDRILTAVMFVVALGALLSWVVYRDGSVINATARSLVTQDTRNLQWTAEFLQGLLEQENIAYEYYVTRDRAAFLERLEANNTACHAALEHLKSLPGGSSSGSPQNTIANRYEQLHALVNALDDALRSRTPDAGRARILLMRIGAQSRDISLRADWIRARINSDMRDAADSMQAAVSRTNTLLSAFTLFLAALGILFVHLARVFQALQAARLELALFPERDPSAVLRLSRNGAVSYANQGARALAQRIGLDAENPRALLPPDAAQRLAALWNAPEKSAIWEHAVDDRVLECRVHAIPDLDVFHAYVTDITERTAAASVLSHHTYHDILTGLPNRRMFKEHVDQTLPTQDRGGMRAAVFVLGLDRFKVIVDSLGHETGDQLLSAVAGRLRRLLDENRRVFNNASLYRFETDQFAVFVPGFTSSQTPILLAEKIVNALNDPFYVGGREFFVSGATGISIFPLDGLDTGTLLKNADSAMHRAKLQGGNSFQCYTQDMNIRATEWLTMENYLRHARERNELTLYFQPQIDARSGRVTGSEALLRWNHPNRGLVLPGEFIPLAEETGMIVAIGEWSLRHACQQNRLWMDQGLGRLTVAVNISAKQFHQQDLPQLVADILAETAMDPTCLELEITEGDAMHDVEHTTAVLHELRRMAVRISIDDFGRGFSSLSYLKRFPLDRLKIDKSFIRHLTTDENDAAITHAVITLGHSMKLRVTAEGVETEEQLAFLRDHGCDDIQGLLFSAPLCADELASFIRKREATLADGETRRQRR